MIYWAPPVCCWYTSIVSPSSISRLVGVSFSLIACPSKRKRTTCIDRPCKRNEQRKFFLNTTHRINNTDFLFWNDLLLRVINTTATQNVAKKYCKRRKKKQLHQTQKSHSKQEPFLIGNTYSTIAVCIHQLTQRCVLLDFELNYRIVLAENFQVDVFRFAALWILYKTCERGRDRERERAIK